MEERHLFQPLLATTNSSFSASTAAVDSNDAENIKFLSSNISIISRLLSIFFIGVISIWANREASKGFEVTIINDAKDSPAGKRFDLFYVSNDKATRILLNTSAFAENILYPVGVINHETKKQVQRVTLRLISVENMTQIVTVDTIKSNGEFVINVCSSVMGDSNVNHVIISALQHGMARIWIWDGQSRASPLLIDGLVEYISMLAGFGRVKDFLGGESSPEYISHLCWDDKDPRVVAQFLDFCEVHENGFIQRLNEGLRHGWRNGTVDAAIGMEAKHLCDSYKKKLL